MSCWRCCIQMPFFFLAKSVTTHNTNQNLATATTTETIHATANKNTRSTTRRTVEGPTEYVRHCVSSLARCVAAQAAHRESGIHNKKMILVTLRKPAQETSERASWHHGQTRPTTPLSTNSLFNYLQSFLFVRAKQKGSEMFLYILSILWQWKMNAQKVAARFG